MFANRFREIAGGALLLPKQRPGRRTPLRAERPGLLRRHGESAFMRPILESQARRS